MPQESVHAGAQSGNGPYFATDNDTDSIAWPYCKLVFGADGTYTKVETGVGLPVNIVSGTSGLSTSAKQDTGNASLAAIDAKLGNTLAANALVTGTVAVSSVGGTVAVSAASLPLPSGAATAANQATEITGLASIDSRLAGTLTVGTHAVTQSGTWNVGLSAGTNSIGNIGTVATVAVVTALTGITNPVNVNSHAVTNAGTFAVQPEPKTSGGCSIAAFLSDNSAKAGVVKASAGQLYGISTGNTNAAACYLRLYNQTSSPSTGATPVARFTIPGNVAGAGREVQIALGAAFATGIAYRITTGAADDNDDAAATNEVNVTFLYK